MLAYLLLDRLPSRFAVHQMDDGRWEIIGADNDPS
jgi:hypothetical protein